MTIGAPLEIFAKGDLVRVRHRGAVLPGVWVFGSVFESGGVPTVSVRRQGYASPRYLRVDETALIDHDARWPE